MKPADVKAALLPYLGVALPIFVENDANVAALGSAHYGAGIPHDHFIMITLGTGVGGAIIYDNRIFRGATGGAGEIGHMTIDYEGPIDRSGVAGASINPSIPVSTTMSHCCASGFPAAMSSDSNTSVAPRARAARRRSSPWARC